MKKNWMSLMLALMMLFSLCGAALAEAIAAPAATDAAADEAVGTYSDVFAPLMDLNVQFGYEGSPFTVHLYDNATTVELARNITDAGRNLPLYDYDDFDECEVLQYYDIPSYYSFPGGDSVAVTSVKAGEIYYSAPNRVILFLVDQEVEGEYTPVGFFENAGEVQSAFLNSQPLVDWDCKVVPVTYKNN